MIATIACTGCGGGKSSATISMTTEAGEVKIVLLGTGGAVSDCGDGSAPENVTLFESSYRYSIYSRGFPNYLPVRHVITD